MTEDSKFDAKQFSLTKTERVAIQKLATERAAVESLIKEVLTDIRTRLGEDDTWNVDVKDLDKGVAVLWRPKPEPVAAPFDIVESAEGDSATD